MTNNKKVLIVEIVEDEASLRNALDEGLSGVNIKVFGAKNGEEGLSIALREHPDLILLDLVMPVMDGMTMLHKLRQDTWGQKTHVIILTNVSDNEKVAEAMKNETFEYFVKADTKIEDLVAKVKAKLGI